MAQEIRKLEFSLAEVENALRVFCAKIGERMPVGPLIRVLADSTSSSRYRAFFKGESEILFPLRDKDILTALLVFCQQNEIPVPKNAQKILKAEGEQVILYLRHG